MPSLKAVLAKYESLNKKLPAETQGALAKLPPKARATIANAFAANVALIAELLEIVRVKKTPTAALILQCCAKPGEPTAHVTFKVHNEATGDSDLHASIRALFGEYLGAAPWRPGAAIEHIEACAVPMRELFLSTVQSAIEETTVSATIKQ